MSQLSIIGMFEDTNLFWSSSCGTHRSLTPQLPKMFLSMLSCPKNKTVYAKYNIADIQVLI